MKRRHRESRARRKTINQIPGVKGFKVLAATAIVRDLRPKEWSVRPDEEFAMCGIVDGTGGEAALKDITRRVKGAEHLDLADRPDREGEGRYLARPGREVMKNRKALQGVDCQPRRSSTEVTGGVLEKASARAETQREWSRPISPRRAPRYLSGLHAVAVAVAQAAGKPLRPAA